MVPKWSWDSSFGIVTTLLAGQSRVRLLVAARDYSLLWKVQNGSEAHPAFYTMGTVGSILRGEVTGA